MPSEIATEVPALLSLRRFRSAADRDISAVLGAIVW